MPIGKKVPESLKSRILAKYLELRKQDPKVTAYMVGDAIRKELQQRNSWAEPDWPSDSTVRKILAQSGIRKSAEELDSDFLDRPWSLAALHLAPLDADALPLVIHLWGLSLTERSPLTVREARWAAWLRYLPYGDEEDLLEMAQDYALKEQALSFTGLYPRSIGEAGYYFFHTLEVYHNAWNNSKALVVYQEMQATTKEDKDQLRAEAREVDEEAFARFTHEWPEEKLVWFRAAWETGLAGLPSLCYEQPSGEGETPDEHTHDNGEEGRR